MKTKCPSRYIPADQVDALVWEDLCQLLTHPEAIRFALERAHGGHWLPQDLQARREALRRGQTSAQQQIERLTEAYLANVVTLEEYRRRRRDLEGVGPLDEIDDVAGSEAPRSIRVVSKGGCLLQQGGVAIAEMTALRDEPAIEAR